MDRCECCYKVLYTSRNTAMASLVGQLKTKRVRVYECPGNKGEYHVTKESLEEAGRRRKDERWN